MNNNEDSPNEHTIKLDSRMKEYEKSFTPNINNDKPFLVRLDGHSFSKFTKNLDKSSTPFDPNFVRAMVLTMNDTLHEFRGSTGYTHSDEITIIFPSCNYDKEGDDKARTHIFNGRTMKIVTLMSGYTTARFNYHINQLIKSSESKDKYSEETILRIEKMEAYFDARIVTFPDDLTGEFINHMVWRSIHDCRRNAISTYARYYFGHSKTNNLNGRQMTEMMKNEGKLDWETDVDIWIKHGVYAKKDKYFVKAFDKKTNEDVEVVRTKVENRCFKIWYDEMLFLPLLFGKYWDDYKAIEGNQEKTIEFVKYE